MNKFKSNIADFLELFLPIRKAKFIRSKKRILIFNWRDTRHIFTGGAEVYIHELAKRWVKDGNTVTLFCGNDGNCRRYEVIEGVQIIRRGGFYTVYFWAFLYYVLKLRNRYDIIIDSENGLPFFTPLYARKKIFCLMFHSHQEVFYKSLVKPIAFIASFFERHIMPIIYRKVKFITISESSKKEIAELGLGQAGIDIVYPGVDITKFSPATKASNPLILYLGRLKYYKSLNIFLRTAKEVLGRIPNAQFIIAGDGEEKDELLKLATRLKVSNRVSFLGRVSDKEKIDLYQRAWVFMNPSFMEGWGITTIEANACGTPVVASDVPGLRDSVNNPHNGFLITYGSVKEFSSHILKLITDDTLRKQMSKEATEWAQQFDWQKSADKSLAIINGL